MVEESERGSRFDKHPVLTISVFLFIAFILVVVSAEIFSRLFLPSFAPMTAERARFWQYSSNLGWEHIPDMKGSYAHPDFKVNVSINSRGLRDREYSLERTEKKRMLVLGDSYAWGFGVEDEEVFSEQLEQQHPEWEIINAGVSGYGTVQQYLYLKNSGLDYKPDVILLVMYDNDFSDNIGEGAYWYNKPYVTSNGEGFEIVNHPAPPQTLEQKIDSFVLGNFYFARVVYKAFGFFLSMPALFTDQADPPSETNDLKATQYILHLMAKLARDENARLIVVQTPLSKEKHQLIQDSCHAEALNCLHLKKHLKQYKNAEIRFPHDNHWNAFGHKVVAGAIDEFLSERQIW